MQQPLMGCTSDLQFGVDSTKYFPFLSGGYGADTLANENKISSLAPIDGTISNLIVKLQLAPGSGCSRIFTLRVNGVDTALTVTISGTNTTGQDNSNTVSITAGDRISLSETSVNSPNPGGNPGWTTLGAAWSAVWNGGTQRAILLSSNPTILSGSWSDRYTGVYGHQHQNFSGWTTPDEILGLQINPLSGTLKNLRVLLSAAPGVGKSITITVRKNQASTGVSVTISDANTTGVDTVNTVSVAPGDQLAFLASRNGTTPAATLIQCGIEFFSATEDSSPIMATNLFSPASKTNINYQHLEGSTIGYGEESNGDDLYLECVSPLNGTMSDFYFMSEGLTFVGSDWIWALQKNDVDTTLAVEIVGNGTFERTSNDTTHDVIVSIGDLLRMSVTPINGSDGIFDTYYSMVFTVEASSSSSSSSSSRSSSSSSSSRSSSSSSSSKSCWEWRDRLENTDGWIDRPEMHPTGIPDI